MSSKMRETNIKLLARASAFASLTAIGAWISIPLFPVPITLQTFFTYLAGLLLGSKGGALSQLIYYMIGIVGLPVFANFSGGFMVLLSPSGGYLIGFIFGAYLIGSLSKGSSYKLNILSCAIGTGIIYLFGITQLTFWLIFNSSLSFVDAFISSLIVGVLPFLIGDTLKILLASYLALKVKSYLK